MNKTNILKRGLVFLLVFAGILTLSACKKNEMKTPYGSLGDTVYLSGNNFSITEKELYKELRVSAIRDLEIMFYEILFKDELNKVDAFIEAYPNGLDNVLEKDETMKEDLLEATNKAIFGTDDVDTIKDYEDKTLNSLIYHFVDSIFFAGIDITVADIDTVNFTNHNSKIFKNFRLAVAKKMYAREKLEADLEDKDSSAYIKKDTDIAEYFKNNVKTRYPLSSINIRFTNKYEADETLRHFNIKVYRSQWYLLPDPREEVVSGYALTVLEDVLKDEEQVNQFNGSLSDSNHKLYYEKYTIDPERFPEGTIEVVLDIDDVLGKFLEIYNTIYPYHEQMNPALTLENLLADQDLVNDEEDNLGFFTKEYDDFVGSQTSLRTYIYNTLSTKDDGVRYTASPRSYGEYYYLSFKLKDHNEDLLTQVDDEDKFITWEDEAKTVLKDYASEYYDELAKNRLTSAYIEQKATERLEEAKVVLYDEILLLHLTQNRSLDYELAKKFNNNLVATVNDTEITVDEYYNVIKDLNGPSIAMDLAVKDILLNSAYKNEIDKKKMDEYKENIENVLTQFGQGMFDGSGFPASMGRKKFLILAFGSETIEEAVEKIYVAGELESLYLDDLESHYGEEIYEHLADYANRLRKQYFSISTSHLLIYVDIDEDDRPDKPEEFFEYLEETGNANKIDEYKDLITELMRKIHDETRRYSSFENGLQAIISSYDKSTKIIPRDDEEDGQLEYTPEHEWAKYKQAGLILKFETLGTNTNSTNYPGSEGQLDQDFFDRLHSLYDEVKADNNLDSNFPKQILDEIPTSYDDVLETAFGWHLILVTAAKSPQSAKFTASDDRKADDDDEYMIYEHITVKDKDGNDVILNMYNDLGEEEYDVDRITANQVRVYLYEKDSEYGLESVPTKVKSALSAYLDPVIGKYKGDYMKMHLLSKLFYDGNFTYADVKHQQQIDRVFAVNKTQFFEYTNLLDNDNLFYEIYSDWFNTFE